MASVVALCDSVTGCELMSAPIQYVPSIALDSVFDALGAFIQPFVGDAQVIRAQVNRVAMPVGSFVELTEIASTDLEVPYQWYDGVNSQSDIVGPKRLMIQADFYGASAGDWCAAIKTVWRTPYTTAQFPAGIAPLYCDDGNESPLITGEEQYERRWILNMLLQYNPIVIVPQQAADTLRMNIVYIADV
jgi:hypothetical protein